VRARLLLPLLLPLLAGAQQPRLAHGILLTFDPSANRLLITPLADQGPPRSISFAKPPPPFEALAVRDYALRADGRLAVSAAGVLPAPRGAVHLILHFQLRDLAQPAVIHDTGTVICIHLAEAAGALWCLGPDFQALTRGQDYGVLYRLGEEDGTPHPVLKRGALPRDSSQSPWAGSAQLLSSPNGDLLAWMPGVRRMARIRDGQVRLDELPWEPRPQALVTAALGPDGRLYALLPLASEETFATPYSLFLRQGRQWERVIHAELPRGARLLAVESAAAVFIDRRGRISRIPLRAQDEDRFTPGNLPLY
jgi:hypothetical protein